MVWIVKEDLNKETIPICYCPSDEKANHLLSMILLYNNQCSEHKLRYVDNGIEGDNWKFSKIC